MKNIGALNLKDFAYVIQGHRKGKTFYVPETNKGLKDYWEETYDFSVEKEDSVKVTIFETRRISQVEEDSYDGDKNVYLLKIDGKDYIFDDKYSSWGDSDPILEEVTAETKTVYQSKVDPDNAFIISL